MLPQSPCDFIPHTQVIALTKMRLELSTANYDGYFRVEIENCLKKMYTPSIYEYQHKIVDICDNAIKIPSGSRKVMGIQFCQPQAVTSEVDELNGQIIAVPNNFYLAASLGQFYPVYGNCHIENFFTVQDGYYYFTNATDETLAIVWYYGFRTDDNGIIMIPDYFESCLANHLGYCFLKKKPNFIGGDVYQTREVRNLYWRDYVAEKAQIIGNDQMEKFDEEKRALRFAMNKMRLNDYSWAPFYNGYTNNIAV